MQISLQFFDQLVVCFNPICTKGKHFLRKKLKGQISKSLPPSPFFLSLQMNTRNTTLKGGGRVLPFPENSILLSLNCMTLLSHLNPEGWVQYPRCLQCTYVCVLKTFRIPGSLKCYCFIPYKNRLSPAITRKIMVTHIFFYISTYPIWMKKILQ